MSVQVKDVLFKILPDRPELPFGEGSIPPVAKKIEAPVTSPAVAPQRS